MSQSSNVTSHDKKIIPGTEVVYRDGDLATDSITGNLVLIPQPSDKPSDPLVLLLSLSPSLVVPAQQLTVDYP